MTIHLDQLCAAYLEEADEAGRIFHGWVASLGQRAGCSTLAVVSMIDAEVNGFGPYETTVTTPLCEGSQLRNTGVLVERDGACLRLEDETGHLRVDAAHIYEAAGPEGVVHRPGHPVRATIEGTLRSPTDVGIPFRLVFESATAAPTIEYNGVYTDLCAPPG